MQLAKTWGLLLAFLLFWLPCRGFGQATTRPAESQTLHVLVGKSVVINMENHLKRVLVSNPNVIDAVGTTPTQVVVSAKVPGTSSLILWDDSGRSRMLDVLVDQDVSGLREALQQLYPNEHIQVEAEEDRLILSGMATSPDVVDNVLKMAAVFNKNLVNSLSMPAVPPDRQVLLEIKFAEVDRTKFDQWGVNLFSTGASNSIGSVTTEQFFPPQIGALGQSQVTGGIGTPPSGRTVTAGFSDVLNLFLFRPDINLGGSIRFLQQHNVLQILAEPNLMALNGKAAHFLAGGEFPYPVVQGGTNFTAVTIQFRPFGVRLDFTGNIYKQDQLDVVHLKVAPEVSTLDFTNALTIAGFTVPAISTRRAETEIELKDGQSFGIAGLLDQRATVALSKIPGIGDIPILGELFRSHNIQKSRTELLVLVTPHVVDPVRGVAPAAPAPPGKPVPFLDTPKFDSAVPKGMGLQTAPQQPPAK